MSPSRPSVDVEDRIDPEETMHLDPSTLDSSKVYRFIHPRPANLQRRISQGYEFVLRSEHEVRLMHEPVGTTSADDKIWNGDTVLMMVDKSRYINRRRQIQKVTLDRLGAQEPAFREKARRGGVKPIIGETKGEPE